MSSLASGLLHLRQLLMFKSRSQDAREGQYVRRLLADLRSKEKRLCIYSRIVFAEYYRPGFNPNCAMRTPSFGMTKIGLRRFMLHA